MAALNTDHAQIYVLGTDLRAQDRVLWGGLKGGYPLPLIHSLLHTHDSLQREWLIGQHRQDDYRGNVAIRAEVSSLNYQWSSVLAEPELSHKEGFFLNREWYELNLVVDSWGPAVALNVGSFLITGEIMEYREDSKVFVVTLGW